MTARELIEVLSALPADQLGLPVLINADGNLIDVLDVTLGQASRLGEDDVRFLQIWSEADEAQTGISGATLPDT